MAARFVAHGGASAGQQLTKGTREAVAASHKALGQGASLLDAVVEGVRILEDDGSYNAGRGSQLRLDGQTVEMDAACMTGDGKFGAVVCVADIRNPILAARRVHDTPHMSLVGDGATAFARLLNLPRHDPPSRQARERAMEARRTLARLRKAPETGWRLESILEHWNYEGGVPADLLGTDTVGVVGFDGKDFAAAASTGGLSITLRGRASDVGMPGAGIYGGPAGAVACTGRGEYVARRLLAHEIHERMREGASAQVAIDAAIETVPAGILTGAIAVGKDSVGAGGNCDMPWTSG